MLTISGELGALASQLGLMDGIDFVDADEPFAFCHGLRRPRLMISRGVLDILDPDELEAVLRHEAAHLHERDPLRILVSRAIATALAFVPFSAGLRDSYLCRRELRADRAAVDAMGDALPMASALARMLRAGHRSAFASLAVGALSATDIRIDHLLGCVTPETALLRSANPLHALAFATLSMLLLCVLVATAHAATGVRPCLPC
ncbi:MAG: M56 family metallopeptidase [Dehalococcoidia bacterium]